MRDSPSTFKCDYSVISTMAPKSEVLVPVSQIICLNMHTLLLTVPTFPQHTSYCRRQIYITFDGEVKVDVSALRTGNFWQPIVYCLNTLLHLIMQCN